MNAIQKIRNKTLFLKQVRLKNITSKEPVYIFHHIHKCGGTSIENALRNWFFLIREYNLPGPPKNLETYRNFMCLSGHFGTENTFLFEKYPFIFDDQRYQLFTIVRDPLDRAISRYFHGRKLGYKEFLDWRIEDYLAIINNWMASVLQCTEDNYEEILGRYFFVGILEELQASLNILAHFMDRKPMQIPHVNKTKRDDKLSTISKATLDDFKQRNQLDYKIYEWAKEKFYSTHLPLIEPDT
ncbi:MAG: sulfotransferase family 2 domain-containing protein [Bacteroidota bacterium]